MCLQAGAWCAHITHDMMRFAPPLTLCCPASSPSFSLFPAWPTHSFLPAQLTLLSFPQHSAVAGESGVAFISCSASEFIEMYMGLGAARVRDVFQTVRRFRQHV